MKSKSIEEIDQEIAAVRECLSESRLHHRCQQQAFHASVEHSQNRLRVLQESFHRRLNKTTTNDLSLYSSSMRQVHSCKSLPDSITLRKQATLLSVSHRIEVLRKATELLEHQTDEIETYMRCERAVLYSELDQIQADFMEQKQKQRLEWDRIEAPLRHAVRVQENAKNHIVSLLHLQQEIRSHSQSSQQHHHILFRGNTSAAAAAAGGASCYDFDDGDEYQDFDLSPHSFNSSFATLDLHQSLSLVSSTFVDSFNKLEDSATEPTNLATLMKQLLALDGTFPTGPENDDLVESSCSDWSRLEQVLSSH